MLPGEIETDATPKTTRCVVFTADLPGGTRGSAGAPTDPRVRRQLPVQVYFVEPAAIHCFSPTSYVDMLPV